MRPSLDLIWMRHDLRIHDNPALTFGSGRPCLLVFTLGDIRGIDGPCGEAASCWLHSALKTFASDLDNRFKTKLLLYPGTLLELLDSLEPLVEIGRIHWNRSYTPGALQRDALYQSAFESRGIEFEAHRGNLLHEPWLIHNSSRSHTALQHFAPFQRASLSDALKVPLPVEAPAQLKTALVKGLPHSSLDDLKLVSNEDLQRSLLNFWDISEKAARDILRAFVKDRLQHFEDSGEFPSVTATSKLSPYLQWGQISVRTIWQACADQFNVSAQLFRDQLLWRDFAYYTLFHDPSLVDQPYLKDFLKFPWNDERSRWESWTQGKTGYPLVDAGMRELQQTGWIHHRIRLVVSSFLVKNLGISWQRGADFFWQSLMDANLPSNTLNWQHAAGCGVDSYPFSRILNPVTQGEKFDPEGTYVYHWLPELRNLPEKWVHQPWNAPPAVLKKAGIELGRDYPLPVVDFQSSRTQALEAFAAISNNEDVLLESKTG